jgi:hypothetical protein
MADHHHAYTWLGSAFELQRDGPRRPAHPDFRTSRVPPLETAHWLLKPASFIEVTLKDPGEAAGWFGGRLREHASAFASPEDRDADAMERRAATAAEAVKGGQDHVGGWYLTGQRFFSVCLIGCSPHRFRPEYACPETPP